MRACKSVAMAAMRIADCVRKEKIRSSAFVFLIEFAPLAKVIESSALFPLSSTYSLPTILKLTACSLARTDLSVLKGSAAAAPQATGWRSFNFGALIDI